MNRENKEIYRYTIDFENVKTYYEFQATIRDALDFPHWYGCNWDAFWDCLTDMLCDITFIEIKGVENVIKRFGEQEYKTMIELFREAKHYANDKYVNDLHVKLIHENNEYEEIS